MNSSAATSDSSYREEARKQGSNDTNKANQTNAANEVQDEVNFGPYFDSNVAVCQLRTSMEVP